MITLTVVVTETSSPLPPPYPRPLIYTVEVGGVKDRQAHKKEILAAVASQRADDLDIEDPAKREILALGLRLEFAFAGDLNAIEDWRD